MGTRKIDGAVQRGLPSIDTERVGRGAPSRVVLFLVVVTYTFTLPYHPTEATVVIPVAAVCLSRLRANQARDWFPTSSVTAILLNVAIAAALAGCLAVVLFCTLTIAPWDEQTMIESLTHELEGVPLSHALVLVGVAYPISEELIFRTGLQSHVFTNYPFQTRVLVPTLVFISGHLSLYGFSAQGVATVLLMSPFAFAFSLLYERTSTVVAPTLLHAACNVTVVLALYGFLSF